jgi:hypothetical protein
MSDYWYNTFDGVFFISVGTLLFGAISLGIKYCLKSKCDKFDCLCLHIHRNTADEVIIEEKELEHLRNTKIENNLENL